MVFVKNLRIVMTLILISILMLPASAIAETNESNDMNEVYKLLKGYHVSGVNEIQLSDNAIDGMIEALGDPYTDYFSKEEWNRYQGSINQNYVGVGMRLGEDQEGFYVVEVFPDSPAEFGGILRGDYIIGVEGKALDELIMTELIESIVGPEGTTVKITVKRLNESIELELTRQRIQIPVVTSKWFTEGVGYINLSGFSNTADKKFAEAMTTMKNNGAKGLIIDMRGNPGGYLHIATNIAEEFMEKGILINTMDRNHINNPIVISNGKSVEVPVVVLVDRDSASASEIIAGALQDHGLATIIGTRTYGKGSVQRLLTLSSGSVLKVTVEEYLTPKLNPVNGVGIKPDVEALGPAAQMLTALHNLGLHDIQIKANNRSMTLNQVSVMDTFDFVQENGKVYVHSRVLAALIDGQISWNGKEQAIEITQGNSKGTFLVSSDFVKLIAGTSLIELNAFKEVFSSFDWSSSGEEIQLNSKQGNDFK